MYAQTGLSSAPNNNSLLTESLLPRDPLKVSSPARSEMIDSQSRQSSLVNDDFYLPAASHRTIIDSRNPLKLRTKRIGWRTDWSLYLRSPFHTLLNMPSTRFCGLFFLAYIFQYSFFAAFYLLMSDQCVEGIEHFLHAFYFSVQTSATIGYGGELTPNPDCNIINMLITLQTITSLMLDYSMLGLVYARFSSPTLRAGSIKFSKSLAMYVDGEHLVLATNVVNVRSKNIINPSIRMLLAITDVDEVGDPLGMPLHMMVMRCSLSDEAEACLSLGLPTRITHHIDERSPLHNLSPKDMSRHNVEILLLVDGTDAMTSHTIQARHSYQAADIVLLPEGTEQHLVRRLPDGTLAVNFKCFRFRDAVGAAPLMEAAKEQRAEMEAAAAQTPEAISVEGEDLSSSQSGSALLPIDADVDGADAPHSTSMADLVDLDLDAVPRRPDKPSLDSGRRRSMQGVRPWDMNSSFMAIRQSLVDQRVSSPTARTASGGQVPWFTSGSARGAREALGTSVPRSSGNVLGGAASPSPRQGWWDGDIHGIDETSEMTYSDAHRAGVGAPPRRSSFDRFDSSKMRDLRQARASVLALCHAVLADKESSQDVREAAMLTRAEVLEVM